ncbi:GyrI-like domain-containing protein [Prosthecobacter sp.]|uniref:GyrI-like domain-containing protein n=1 Tax=Prosthecobacter sp. TaxID=1965333 RepID=UPI00248A14D9|nr:GyrI-like domain-containing protein [Prosthecobacter sp.]MDI1310736.1 GyrI-like domain-containing protein [Prosthecobacter sp.]
MLAPLTIVQTEAQPAAVIHLTVPRDQIQEVMCPAIMESVSAASAQGIGPIGPVFAHHFGMTPGIFNFEVGVPVSGSVTPVGRVFASAIPAAKVARTIYTGPYEGLGDAWSDFNDLIEAAGHTLAPNLWECYLAGPSTTPNPADYQTELNHPIL